MMRSDVKQHRDTVVPLDVVPPAQIAQLVEEVGVKKTKLSALKTMTLGILAGAFIAFGAAFYAIVVTGSELGFGPTRLLGGLVFSLGLVMVIVGGAELFTGNSLIVIGWADGRISTSALLRNWALVYVGNLIGALGIALLVHLSGMLESAEGAVGQTVRSIGDAKVALDGGQAFVRGILCNILVCLAVWMCFAAHTVTGKVFAIIFPIAGFVAMGFEHSVANMMVIPLAAFQDGSTIGVFDFLQNLVPVTLGNIVGGGGFVAAVYWLVYIR